MEKCFVDLKKQVKDSKFARRRVDDDGTKIEFKKMVRQIHVTEYGSYEYKHSLTEEENLKKVNILPKSLKSRKPKTINVRYLPDIDRKSGKY